MLTEKDGKPVFKHNVLTQRVARALVRLIVAILLLKVVISKKAVSLYKDESQRFVSEVTRWL